MSVTPLDAAAMVAIEEWRVERGYAVSVYVTLIRCWRVAVDVDCYSFAVDTLLRC